MTARSVPEWIATNPDQAIPNRVKLRVFERCEGRCALTGKKLRPGDAYDFDHERPLIMGGEHRESNLRVVCREAHREKSKAEVSAKAKADRTRLKFIGAWPKSKRPLQGRGFEKRGATVLARNASITERQQEPRDALVNSSFNDPATAVRSET